MASSTRYKNVTFALDGNDISVKNGKFVMAKGKDAYLVQIHTLIKTLKGEILLAPSLGIDYFDTVFHVEHINGIYVWAKRVRDAVMGFDFVLSIVKFDYELKKNMVLEYTLVVQTDDGIVTARSLMASVPNDSDLPTFQKPLRGQTFSLSTDEDVSNVTHKIASATDIGTVETNTLEDQYKSTKKIVKSLGGNTIDEVGDVEYNSDIPPYKPLDGQTLPLETDEDLHEDTRTIIEILGGTVE